MTSSSINTLAVNVEGHSTNRPSLFDGSTYQFWSNRMSIFMRAYNYEMWDVVLDSSYVSMKTKAGSEALEPKLRSEWTELEIKKTSSKLQNDKHSPLCVKSN